MRDKNGKTILLVEDEMIIAMAQMRALERYGYDVIAAYSGDEAVALFKKNSAIDLILMDIDLGKGMSGPDAATEILKVREVPVVFLSSHTEPEIVEQTETITSYGYVVKNSGITVLDASIKMAFKLFDANRRLSTSNEDLRHHSQLLENIIENFPGFVLWKDPDSNFLGCNTNFARKTGFTSPADIIGKNDYDLPFRKEEVEGFLVDDRMVMATRKPKLHFEEREHVANDEEIFLDTCKIPLFDAEGNVSGILAVAMEITEHKRAEAQKDAALAALRESEFKYRSLIEHSTDVVFCVNEKGEYQFTNQVFASTFGKTPDYFIGKTFWDVYPKEHADYRQAASKKVFETGEPQSVEVEVPLPDRTLYFLAKANPIRDETGKVFLNLTTATDITDRKHNEEELANAKALLDAAFEQTPIPMVLASLPDGVLRYANRACREFLGIEDEPSYVGQSLFEFKQSWQDFTPDGRLQRIEGMPLARAMRGKSVRNAEYYVITKNGEKRWELVNASPIYNSSGELIAAYIIFPDITDRKQMEDALKRSEIEYRALFEQAAVGVAKIETSTGRFVTINQRYCDIVGYSMDEMLHLSFQTITLPEDLQADLDNMELLRRDKLREFTLEKRYLHKNGSIVWVNLTVSPLWQPGETPDFHVAIVEDITKRKIAEKRIHDLLAEKELLLKEVYHRVKNSMNTIKSLISLQLSTEKNPSAAESLRDTLGRVQSMITLYDRLYGSQNYREMPVRDYLQSLAGEIVGSFPNSGIVALALEVDDFILHVNVLSSLGIIVNELLTNSMKYAFAGRVSGEIRLSATRDDGCVTIVVQDNGVGIPASIDFGTSTGFGISLVKMLAEQIGGTVAIERGAGTRFVLRFSA